MCTGNVCRSPAAECLLREALGPSVMVASAGTHAVRGQPMDSTMASLLRERGVEVREFAARQVTSDMLLRSDLVLAATLSHRTWLVELSPSVVRRCFTLIEFARIVTAVGPPARGTDSPSQWLDAAVPLAAARRSDSETARDDMSIPDPRGLSRDTHLDVLRLISTSTRAIRDAALK